ncbi:GFA family protein [Shimia sp. SDUM112013]|uniref:GFA family protein n=1 Tax=Shimia sp. SDUM112013 TaxID=3136160 RepID=UPI0032ED08B4
MPSDAPDHDQDLTGRCYRGAVSLHLGTAPLTVTYCYCEDCRRWTGAPAPAFAAFAKGALHISTLADTTLYQGTGVTRRTRAACGLPPMACFEYLPEQVYVLLGLLDQAATVAPQPHCHAASALPRLHIDDNLPRHPQTGRLALNAAGRKTDT